MYSPSGPKIELNQGLRYSAGLVMQHTCSKLVDLNFSIQLCSITRFIHQQNQSWHFLLIFSITKILFYFNNSNKLKSQIWSCSLQTLLHLLMSNLFFKSYTTVSRKIAVGQKNASSYALQLNLPCVRVRLFFRSIFRQVDFF